MIRKNTIDQLGYIIVSLFSGNKSFAQMRQKKSGLLKKILTGAVLGVATLTPMKNVSAQQIHDYEHLAIMDPYSTPVYSDGTKQKDNTYVWDSLNHVNNEREIKIAALRDKLEENKIDTI